MVSEPFTVRSQSLTSEKVQPAEWNRAALLQTERTVDHLDRAGPAEHDLYLTYI